MSVLALALAKRYPKLAAVLFGTKAPVECPWCKGPVTNPVQTPHGWTWNCKGGCNP